MQREKQEWLAIGVGIVVFTVIASLILSFTDSDVPLAPRMFSDISQMEILSDYEVERISDPNIGNLEYTASYCSKVQYNNSNLSVYAYEFDSAEAAWNYCRKALGDSIASGLRYAYSSYTNLTSSIYAAYYENKAMVVQGRTQNQVYVLVNSIGASFPHDISDLLRAMLEQVQEEYGIQMPDTESDQGTVP